MKVGVTSWFANIPEYEARVVTGDYSQPYPVPDAQRIRDELDLADLVEPLGFDSFWTIEHHFSPYGMTTNPIQLLTYVAARTTRIDVGSMVMVLPWHDPLHAAEDIALLDNLLGGRRFWIGTGRGFAAREYNALRIPYETSSKRLEESLEVIRLALTEEFFEFDGEIFQIPRTTIRPRPLTSDLTRQLMMVWASPPSMHLAAHEGLAPLFTNYIGWDQLATQYAEFQSIRAEHGWPAIPSTVAATIYCHDDQDYAEHRGRELWQKSSDSTFWHYDRAARQDWLPDVDPIEKQHFLDSRYEDQASAGIFGTPEVVIEKLRELQRVANVGHLVTLHSYGDIPRVEAERNMRKFAADVLPTIRQFPVEDIYATPYRSVRSGRLKV
jgi:alkanesulfonate monooxygenase SsuD/methylene tetrahydromethanopterin reductase-like flavin-dependent oxidoreductase (luciferase family)